MTRTELIKKLKAYGLALKETQANVDDDGEPRSFAVEQAAFHSRIELERALLDSSKEEIEALTTGAK